MVRTPRRRGCALAGISMAAVALAGSGVFTAAGPEVAPGTPNTLCGSSSASVGHLVRIGNATERRFQCLGLSLEGETIKAIRLETHSFVPSRGNPDAQLIDVTEFSPAMLDSDHGAVLDGVPGHDAIILRGHLSTLPGKTQILTSYLYNGFTGEYRSCQITLDREPNAGWRLVNRFGQPISNIIVKTREMPIIGAFGIASLVGACS